MQQSDSIKGGRSMQQYSTIQSQSLKGRLYKNLATEPKDRYELFEKKLMQPTSITPSTQSSQKLIPKVALRSRLEPLQTEQKSTLGVTISQGKILIDRSARANMSQFQSNSNLQDLIIGDLSMPRTTLNRSKNLVPVNTKFLSQNNMLGNEDSIIGHRYQSTLGDESIVGILNQEQQQQGANSLKKKIKEKKEVARKPKKGGITRSQANLLQDNRDYLTPMDFIHLIRTDPEMIDEFCYLNKQSNPYDFKIVEFDERNQKEYMTISARGITHFLDDEATFLTIEEWEREARMFGKLRGIEFFKKYKLWKNFFLWKRLMRRNIMLKNQQVMNTALFSVDRQLRMTLLEVRRLCQNMAQEIRFVDSNFAEPQRVEDFKISQDKHRMSYMDVKFDAYEQQIKELVIQSCQKSLYTFKEENRIPLREENEDDTEERAPLLVGDESGKEMPYTQEATIRTHYRKLHKFVKLIDYLVMDSKLNLMASSADQLVQQIHDMNVTYEENKGLAKGYKVRSGSKSWIIVESVNKADVIYFNPTKDGLKKIFEEIISKVISRICSKHRELLTIAELQQFIQSDTDESQMQSEPVDVKGLIYSNEAFLQSQSSLKKELEQSFYYVEEYATILQPYLQWFIQNTEMNVVNHFKTQDIDDFKNAVNTYKEQDLKFQSMEGTVEIGLVLFDNVQFKERIRNSAAHCQSELYKFMPELNYQKATEFISRAQSLHNMISVLPATVEQFVVYMDSVNSVSNHLDDLGNSSQEITAMTLLIEELKIKISEKYRAKFQDVNQQLGSLRKKVEDAMANQDQNLNRFRKDMEKMVPLIDTRVKELKDRLNDQPIGNVKADLDKLVSFIKEIRAELNQINDSGKKLNQYQVALQMEYTPFEVLEAFQTDFGLYEKLWCGRKQWVDCNKKWQTQQYQQVDLEDMTNIIEILLKSANLCAKELEMNDMARLFKTDIEAFKGIHSVLTSLRDPALREKEWDSIRVLINQSVENGILKTKIKNPFIDLFDQQYTVGWIQDNGLYEIKDKLSEISLKASKEVELVKMIEGVESVWRSSSIVVVSYRDSKELSILGNNEDLISKIDDTLLTVNNILASRFVEGIRNRVEQQLKLLRYFQELVDEWILHQRNWLYLEPILNSPFSAKNLVKETKIFQQADGQWKKIMKQARDNPLAKRWADDFSNRLIFNILRTNNNNFDLIQKALDEFLEKKREVFQRFFFLSNDELLEILSQAKNLQTVQPFLRKCFENINKIQFDKSENPIGMISAEGEIVPLRNFQARGSEVEEWLKLLEEQMKYSLKVVMRNALIKYKEEDTIRRKWVLDYPLQVVVSLDSVFWTQLTEENYLASDAEGDLDDWFEQNVAMLDELTVLIRGDLTDLQRRTLVALVTQDVHFRDIIDTMRTESVEGIMDFKWQQQLRFYYEEESIHAKQINAKLQYGYEYLGSTTRLVITPLTDRCWMTITGALGIKLGAAPQGPAGTGKTESCKDLAKALGRYCIVFNCSDQITAKMMEKLFTGLAYCGAWACLDEFNRIYIEVLSVIAQQVQTIREALLENRQQFNFFSKNVTLNPSLGIFITMNPGYAGRTELPDNLKVLFRPVAMMVPDYRLIAEIMLGAEGFSNAKDLSNKMTKLYKLSSEQLSQQDHYDFGMRAVKSLLVMAGSLKRAEINLSEDIVLIRAMREANIPKFLSHDIPLFNAIVQDLFPGLVIPQMENKELTDVIKFKIEVSMLEQTPNFVEKVVQFHETLKVRFGVMLVGQTMGGKSECLRILRETYIKLFEKYRSEGNDVHPVYQNIEIQVLNPKAISMEELYGQFDIMTQQWTDGLASNIMRQYASQESLDKKWMVFDGPVDALWIENMNTVLDDSMTLCLSNGERVKLKNQMRMLFEVQDLSVASPATVSRCGMVYLDDKVVGYAAIVKKVSSLELNELLDQDVITHLQQCIQVTFKKSILNIKQKTKQLIAVGEVQMAVTIVRLIKMIIINYNKSLNTGLKESLNKKHLDKIFLWCFVWAIGSTLSTESMEAFEKIVAETFPVDSLPRGSALDYLLRIDQQEGKVEVEYDPWEEQIPKFQYRKGMSYFDMVVETKETVSYGWFIGQSVESNFPLFITGVTGTGKTIMINTKIEMLRDSGKVTLLGITLSAKTTSQATQSSIEQKLQTQRKNKRIILMPPPGKKLIMFVDDINMPATEVYGAQPPIEMLRQFIDFKGIYDRKSFLWKDVESTVLICACGPPGGGRSALSPRFTRHFNLMSLPNSSEETLSWIFSTIIKNFFKHNNFKPEIIDLGESNALVNATLQIYNEIQKALLPTPDRSHYVFNLRDVSKVFQGVLFAKSIVHTKGEQIVRLWAHETCRVFMDRLINQMDQDWFKEQLLRSINIYFKFEYKKFELFDQKPPLLFADFMKKGVELNERIYDEVKDYNLLTKVIKDYMGEETKLNLVLFKDAIEHLSRIARVLRQQRGHYMLVGVGGSGKKSLTTLGAVLAGCKVDTLEQKKNYGKKEFKEDIFRMMCRVSIDNEILAFSFQDTQILQEGFLEDVNNLLNSGEIPNMLTKEDLDIINNGLANEAKQYKINDVYAYFLQKVRSNLHIILGMSPIGGQLRVRLRMFPSLVNCCTIEWLQQWPEDALLSVSSMFLENLEYDGLTNEIRNGLYNMCVYIHQTVEEICPVFYASLKRNIYITPKSYLELIESYKELLKMKKDQLLNNKIKLSQGLQKLFDANAIISDLKSKLTEMQPILKQKTIEQEQLIRKLEIDSFEANKVKAVVYEEERQVNEKASEIKEMKAEADKILNDALPTLQAAQDALNTLNRNDISEIKGNNNPHQIVKFTLECVTILFEEKNDWENIKKLLADPNFLSRMKNLNVQNINPKTEVKIKAKIATNPLFIPSEIQKINFACKSICEWVRAVSEFTGVNKDIEKKKSQVEAMNVELEKAETILKGKQNELGKVIKKVNDLEQLYTDNKKEKDRLDQDIRTTEQRLIRAEELTVGLADEQERWKETVIILGGEIKLLLGNVFLASGAITYLGPFTGQFRDGLVQKWLLKAEEYGIPHKEKYALEDVLGEPVKIQQWQSKGLPKDYVSLTNGIITEYCRSFPLFIDPQTQANKWIKNTYIEAGIKVVKVSQESLIKHVENAIRSGLPLMIEDVGEQLESMLEPLLLKQFTYTNRRIMIRLGDSDIEYDKNFKLFLSTKLANPNFLPDVFIRVTVVNFTVTDQGLEEQLLGDVVFREMPEIENTKQDLIQQIARGKLNLKRNEEKILELLATSKGMILDNVDLIENLKLSKQDAKIVQQSLIESEEKQVEIEKARLQYKSVAVRGSLLYFVVADFALIDPMYQFSLNYFKRLFGNVIESSEKSDNIEQRINTLLACITETIYLNVCRGLFNAHKRIFSFLMSAKIQLKTNQISNREWQLFVRGPKIQKQVLAVPKDLRLSEKQWNELQQVSQSNQNFSGLPANIQKNWQDWEIYLQSEDPWNVEIPEINGTITPFQRLMLIKCLREEESLYAMTYYVDSILGKKFTSNNPPSIEEIYNDTDHKTPLIFILSAGADPLTNLLRFAQNKKIPNDKMTIISLGQGQGILAERAIDNCFKNGGWVILQNCHLGKSFMPQLEKKLESFEDPEQQALINTQFRLILTSMPCDYFPVTILQNGVKLTTEPPKGLKSNMYKSYSELPEDYFEGCEKPQAWKKLIYSLSFFHAVVQERRKFGPLGWNIRYEFNDSDFETSYTLLRNFLDTSAEIPWDALNYVIGEITYGGRVTDDWDRRCLLRILSKFVNEDVLVDGYSFTESGSYKQQPDGSIDNYKAIIEEFPDFEKPEVFGMNANANITFKLTESKSALLTILSIQPRETLTQKTNEGEDPKKNDQPKTQDQVIDELCDILQSKLPQTIKSSKVAPILPQKNQPEKKRIILKKETTQQTIEIDSLRVCVQQEVQRFNKLIATVQLSIINLKKAIKGEVVMSAELDKMYQSLLNNQVPSLWSNVAYPSLKPLASFYDDMILRISFIRNWFELEQGQYPTSYWISAFFFPQGFLTSVLQTFSRKNQIPIDILGFSFKFLNQIDHEQLQGPPENGAYIHGLFIEGTRFDTQKMILDDSLPGVTITKSPIIHFNPTENYKPDLSNYSMPLYKTSLRAGTLSTTGHSTNFIISIETPTKKSADYWILNGGAYLTQLND